MNFNIGINIDLEKLLVTRMLIQANSGGGKSFLLRKVLEETNNKVQQIILDWEGEFSTLREKYDYILIGEEGDVKINMRYIEDYCYEILKSKKSAIINLYDLKRPDRIIYVKKFLEALIDAPKSLYQPLLCFIDEAQTLCPEDGKAESYNAVIELLSQGRKRGYCAILATQRLSRLSKNATAECNNIFIGRTGQDLDMIRAGFVLGMDKKNTITLRNLKPGEFYCFGPAVSTLVEKFKVSPVKTTHPEAGKRIGIITPPPTENIKKALEKFANLPQEAEQKLKDIQDYKSEINKLHHKIGELESGQLSKEAKEEMEKAFLEKLKISSEEIRDYSSKIVEEITNEMENIRKKYIHILKNISEIINPELVNDSSSKIELSLNNFAGNLDGRIKTLEKVFKPCVTRVPFLAQEKEFNVNKFATPKYFNINHDKRHTIPLNDNDKKLGKCSIEILKFLYLCQGKSYNKRQIGAMTGYSHSSGGFNNALSELNTARYIVRTSDKIEINRGAIPQIIDKYPEIKDSAEDGYSLQRNLELWLNKLSLCARKIYEVVIRQKNSLFSKEELGQITGYSHSSGGFNNALSELSTLGLIERFSGQIRFNSALLNI